VQLVARGHAQCTRAHRVTAVAWQLRSMHASAFVPTLSALVSQLLQAAAPAGQCRPQLRLTGAAASTPRWSCRPLTTKALNRPPIRPERLMLPRCAPDQGGPPTLPGPVGLRQQALGFRVSATMRERSTASSLINPHPMPQVPTALPPPHPTSFGLPLGAGCGGRRAVTRHDGQHECWAPTPWTSEPQTPSAP
jgi:hypothetical protein